MSEEPIAASEAIITFVIGLARQRHRRINDPRSEQWNPESI